MTPTPMPIAVRAYTVRTPKPGNASMPAGRPPKRTTRTRGGSPKRPKYIVIFDWETTVDPSQAATFGSARVLKRQPDGSYAMLSEVLFHADDLAETDPTGFATLARYASEHRVTLMSRDEFMRRIFLQYVIRLHALLVGFNLPFDIARLALHAGEARAPNYGGFSFQMYDYMDKVTGVRADNTYRPRIYVKSLDSKRAFIGFTRTREADDTTDENLRGHFLDVRTLAFALSGQSFSLAGACEAYKVEHAKLAVEEHGVITPDYIAYNRRDTLATQELLMVLWAECDALGFAVNPSKLYSPASLAKGAYRAMKLRSPSSKAPTIDPSFYGWTMSAFFGGRAEIRVRRVPLPVVTVDFRSMYPTVAILQGVFPILRAKTIRYEECTEEVQAILADASLGAILTPALWRKLNVFIELSPDAALVPVRAKYSETRDGLNIGLNYLTSATPLIYPAPDLYHSALRTGRTPTIMRAWRVVGEGVQEGLQPISFGGRVTVDPRTDDFFKKLIEERVRVKGSSEYSKEERDRITQHIKLIANSGSYGVFAELNREELPVEDTEEVAVYGHDEPFNQDTRTPEDMGEFCFPPIAALVASGARLMLGVFDCLVEERGGPSVFSDTDSAAIIATKHGGLIECEGGTADETDRIPAVRALSHQDIRNIVERLNALNPYDRTIIPNLLNIEDINFEHGELRELYAYAVSAKRYVLYSWRPDGTIQIEKASEHGLGHLIDPLPKDAGQRLPVTMWQLILDRHFDLPHETPAWRKLPAMSRVSVSTPAYFRGFLARYKDMPYAERIKPYGFLISAQVARLGHPAGTDPKHFHLIGSYSADPETWTSRILTDAYSGQDYAITTALSYQPGVVRVKSYEDVLEEFLAHGEPKSATSDGAPAGASARGVLSRRHVTPSEIRLIGKESNALELVEAGMIGDWDAVLSRYGSDKVQPSAEQLRSASAAALANRWGVSVRTVRTWRRKQRANGSGGE